MTKLGLAVITYEPANAGPAIYKRIDTFLDYFRQSKFPGEFAIFNDGPLSYNRSVYFQYRKHRTYVTDVSKGISHVKNRALNYFFNYTDCELLMIAEDDIILMPDFWEPYVDAYLSTGIEHFSWCWDQIPWPWDHSSVTFRKETVQVLDTTTSTVASINNPLTYPVVRTSHVNGCFMVFTRKLFETIGYFKILPNPWGHEHTNYSMRAVAAGMCPFFTDVVRSNDYILMGPYANASTVSIEDKLKWEVENESAAMSIDSSNLKEPYYN